MNGRSTVPDMSESVLDKKLAAALASRDDRNTRIRLPDPSLSHSPSTPGAISPADFTSGDYLSLSRSSLLRARVLAALHSAPEILGSGGSRVAVYNREHAALEDRVARTFRSPAAILFNSGFDANVGFFSCVPQPGDALLHDESIHASVHDGVQVSRVAPRMRRSFAHNNVGALGAALRALRDECAAIREGKSSVFVAVESVYSMNGTVAPLRAMLDTIDEVFPAGNAHLIVDEAHATGLYGPGGRGMVALLGLEDRVLVRLHTFVKALAASGAVLLTSTLIRDYLLNYARSLIYTSTLSNASIIAVSCSLDLLEDGTAERLAAQVLENSTYLQERFRARLAASSIPSHILALLSRPQQQQRELSITQLPSPIIPLLTPRANALSTHLLAHGLNARAMNWPVVPKGTDRVRVCLHASNTREEIDALINVSIAWAVGIGKDERGGPEGDRTRIEGSVERAGPSGGNSFQSKL